MKKETLMADCLTRYLARRTPEHFEILADACGLGKSGRAGARGNHLGGLCLDEEFAPLGRTAR